MSVLAPRRGAGAVEPRVATAAVRRRLMPLYVAQRPARGGGIASRHILLGYDWVAAEPVPTALRAARRRRLRCTRRT
jgi:hypothetical protein